MTALYDTDINNNSCFGNKFDKFQPLYSDFTQFNRSVYVNLLQKLNSKELFHYNFLKCNVLFNDNKYIIKKYVAAFLLNALGAQVGGV